MSSNGKYQQYKLGELGKVITGKTPPTKDKGNFGGSVPFVTPSDFDGSKVIRRTARFLTEDGIKAVKNCVIPEHAVMVTCIGSDMGKVALTSQTCVTNQQINSIVVSDDHCAEYVYYCLATRQAEFKNLAAGGSAQPILNKGHFSQLPITLPPKRTQQSIARFVGVLDDKIELNSAMNRSLFDLGRLLFRTWFIDYTPMSVRFNGSGFVIDEAMPISIELAENGLPHCWELAQLGTVADVNWGDTNTTKASYVDEGFPAYSASGPDGFLPYHDFDRKGVIVSAIGANAGITWFARGKWSCIKNTLRFWCTAPALSDEYLYFATADRNMWPLRGSAQPFISQGDARAMKVLVPGQDLAATFGRIIAPAMKLIDDNVQENRKLVRLRDSILPRLLTGELSLGEAERILECV